MFLPANTPIPGSPVTASPDPKLYELMTSRVVDYAIFLLDPEGHIMSWNAGAASIKRYTAEEIIGKHFSTFYTPADIARNWPAIELQRAKTEGRFEDTGWRVRKDGSRFWANVILTALRDNSGKLLAFSKITRDLTQRRAEEESLRLSEERFRLLVEGVEDYAIYLLSPDGVITSWNAGARRIKGYEAGEIIGKHFSKFYTPEDVERGKPWTELAIARETGRAEDEGWRVRKDGTTFWARVVVTALHDSEGKMHGFAKVTQDLTQRRHSEALEAASTNLTDFIAVLAHELRNPLAPIRNAVQLQRLAAPGDPVQELSRNIIDRQSGQLSRMVEDLLDVSRITRGTLSFDMRPVGVATIIERAVETSRPAISEAGHTLKVELGELPPHINGDELRLAQALTNLLNNAARYTDAGGEITLKVTSIKGVTSKVAISVRDTGRGIEPAFLHSIFGMFVQGRNMMNRPAAGLGVGLALARSIVELHHGTLTVASEGTGKGAEFTITLPALAEGSDAAEAPMADAPAAPAKSPSEKKYRILVVDDNVDAADSLGMLLKVLGADVRVAHDGRDALAMFPEYMPAVVLLDIGMPGMDGYEVARTIRARHGSEVTIVALTGWGQDKDRQRAREAGFDHHLVKPAEIDALQALLASLDDKANSKS
jgi:PAS domain S-box-containing protein